MTRATRPADVGTADLWWNDGDAFRSRLFDAISLLLPSGEQFVIAAMSDWLQAAQPQSPQPPALQREARRFIGEEKAHARAHRLYNEKLAAHAPAQRLEQRVISAMDEMAGRSLATRIAFAAAFEHLTALLSAEALRPRGVWIGAGMTPQLRLWRWHCQEELDHRHVALDVMKALRVGHGLRVCTFLAAALYLASDLLVSLIVLCRSDVRARRIGGWRLLAQAAAFAARATPGLMRMAWGGLRYIVALGPAK